MPWCQKCKTEYRGGIAVCADCGSPLTEQEAAKTEISLLFGEQAKIELLLFQLTEQGIESAHMDLDETEKIYELKCSEAEAAAARELTLKFLQAAEENEEEDKAQPEKPVAAGAGLYQRKAEKAGDYLSSAYLLIGIGGFGILALFANGTELLVLPLLKGNFLMNLVMGTLFLVFFIMGVHSYRIGKQYHSLSAAEEQTAEEMYRFLQERLEKEAIDQVIQAKEDEAEEILYFQRTDYLKDLLRQNYPNQEEGLMEEIVERIYQEYVEG